MSCAVAFPISPINSRMGRPFASTVPEQRALHLEVLRARLLSGLSIRETARRFRCSAASVKVYQRWARGYPEAAGILRVAKSA